MGSNERNEKAILVGCILHHQDQKQSEGSLEELSLLTETAQAEAVLTMTQKRDKIDASYYVGRGKVEEIEHMVNHYEADVVIFNAELSPSQAQNIEQIVSCKVIDRTQLILDIFARRAKSKEGKLQVELAQLRYLLPRIVGQGTVLSRLGGGIGTRGPGETQLEVERRYIRRRMQDIEKQLQKIVAHRERYRERRQRNQVFQIALVGYTNAGKSTLLNRLSGAEALIEDQLFATLDPATKQLKLPSGLTVLLSDTVGFIQDLPTTLIAAFRSTLEEVKEADLILHVIDSTDDKYDQQVQVVEELIEELEAAYIPVHRIFNKKDLPPADHLLIGVDDSYISAFDDHDLQQIKQVLDERVKQGMIFEKLFIPADKAELLASIRQQGILERTDWMQEHNGYWLEAYLSPQHTLESDISAYRQ